MNIFMRYTLYLIPLLLLSACSKDTKKEVRKEEPMRTIFIYYGPPACGKGTLAARCVREGYISLSTGDLLRQNITSGSELGKRAQEFVSQGKLVPDELVIAMVRDWLNKQVGKTEPIILDGFPRTYAQAAALLDMLNEGTLGKNKVVVIRFTVSEDEVVKRIVYRVICSNKSCQHVYSLKEKPPVKAGICDICQGQLIKRSDDTEEVIRKRFKDYMQTEAAMLDFFKSRNIPIKEISAEQPMNEVYKAFKAMV